MISLSFSLSPCLSNNKEKGKFWWFWFLWIKGNLWAWFFFSFNFGFPFPALSEVYSSGAGFDENNSNMKKKIGNLCCDLFKWFNFSVWFTGYMLNVSLLFGPIYMAQYIYISSTFIYLATSFFLCPFESLRLVCWGEGENGLSTDKSQNSSWGRSGVPWNRGWIQIEDEHNCISIYVADVWTWVCFCILCHF